MADGVVDVSETKYPVTPTLSVADMEMVFNGELVDDAPPFIMKLDAVVFFGAVVSEVVPPPPPVVSLPPPPPHADKPTKTVKQTTAHIFLFIKMPPPLHIGISLYQESSGSIGIYPVTSPVSVTRGAQNTSNNNSF